MINPIVPLSFQPFNASIYVPLGVAQSSSDELLKLSGIRQPPIYFHYCISHYPCYVGVSLSVDDQACGGGKTPWRGNRLVLLSFLLIALSRDNSRVSSGYTAVSFIVQSIAVFTSATRTFCCSFHVARPFRYRCLLIGDYKHPIMIMINY